MIKFIILCMVVWTVLVFIAAPGGYGKGKVQESKNSLPAVTNINVPASALVKRDPGFGNIPLYFIPNKGQVNEKARFYAGTSRFTLWLTKEGLVFDSIKRKGREANRQRGRENIKYERDVSRFIFIGADKNPGMVPLETTGHRVNYFKGKNSAKWQKNVSTSKAVLYKNIYKNIDLKIYGIEKQVEYDWMVKPGGDPGAIMFAYEHAKTTSIDNEGNLVIETEFGRLMHKKPVSYQVIEGRRVSVGSAFRAIRKNTYGFTVDAYNRDYEIIIDPVVTLVYSTYLGGSGDDMGLGIVVDGSGYIYVSGRTDSTDFPTENPYQNTLAGYLDVIVTKFSPDGSALIFSTYIGGGGWEEGYCTALAKNGIYVAGTTQSSDFPAENNHGGGVLDAFICMLDFSGDLKYSRFIGGSSYDDGFGLAVDKWDNAYVTGETRSRDFPILNGFQDRLAGDKDVFVSKVHYNNGLIYSTYLGGSKTERGLGAAVDDSGACYVTGDTYSRTFPTTAKAYQNTFGGGDRDCFVSKIKPTGSDLVYSTFLGGADNEAGWGITVDGKGNAYVAGNTFSGDFPTKNAYQDNLAGPRDAFLTKLDPGGSSLIHSTYLGGVGYEVADALAIDKAGNIYVTGFTNSNDFPIRNAPAGYGNIYVTKFLPGGTALDYSTYFGGSAADYNSGIAVDKSGNAYVTGFTYSSNFPTKNAYQDSFAGGRYDCFVSKLSFLPSTYTLSVQSTPITGVPVTVSPNDADGMGDGNTDFLRAYAPGTEVTLTAPAAFNNNDFYKWTIDGVDDFQRSVQVTMNGDLTAAAVYREATQTYTLAVQSTPNTGVTVKVSPKDNNGEKGGETNFTRTYNDGVKVTLTAPKTFGDKVFHKWSIDGIANFNRTIKVAMNGDRIVSAVYRTPVVINTLIVKSGPDGDVPVTVTPNDNNGSGDGSTAFTRIYNAGTVVTLTAPGVFNGNIFSRWKINGVKNYAPTIQLTMDNDYTATVVYHTRAAISLNPTRLSFGAKIDGSVVATGDQTFFIDNSGENNLDWTVSADAPWLECSPTNGTGPGEVTVSVNPSGLSPGSLDGTITVSDPNAANSPQTVRVKLEVYDAGAAGKPFGYFETPVDDAYVYGSIPVTGWALDDIEVVKVKIYREENNNLVYIGDAVFVAGSRSDVEQAFPNYPYCRRAGWGYMMLTNFLPDGGNGTFTLHAIATDKEGNRVTLGTKTIVCNNADAVRPFGAIDTPAQGAIISGGNYRNQGWALTPPPNKIPEDGHTITVWIDGTDVGKCNYNVYRQDVAVLFPGYANSGGAYAYFDFDTAAYENGLHTIYWTAMDNAGNIDGIGSRYFSTRNTAGDEGKSSTMQAAGGNRTETGGIPHYRSLEELSGVPFTPTTTVGIKKGYNPGIKPGIQNPDVNGIVRVEIKELERMEFHLNSHEPGIEADGLKSKHYAGYLLVGSQLRRLPTGSALDKERGIFYWQPGPGFIGKYRFIFFEKDLYGKISKKLIHVKIVTKFKK